MSLNKTWGNHKSPSLIWTKDVQLQGIVYSTRSICNYFWRLVIHFHNRYCSPVVIKSTTGRASVVSVPRLTIWGQCWTAALIITADWALGGCDSSKSAVLTSLTFRSSLSPRQIKAHRCHSVPAHEIPSLETTTDSVSGWGHWKLLPCRIFTLE